MKETNCERRTEFCSFAIKSFPIVRRRPIRARLTDETIVTFFPQ